MISHFFIPSLPRMTGGLAVMSKLAGFLNEAGFSVQLVTAGAPPAGWDAGGLELLPLTQARPTAGDIWLVPEGFSNALAPGLSAGARCIVFVQNWAYLLPSLPQGIHWSRLDARFLAISQPVAWFTEWATGKKADILRHGIDQTLFYPAPERRALAEQGLAAQSGPVRIAWMPRKNRALAQQIRQVFEARLPLAFPARPPRVEWVEIHNKNQTEVADILRSCHIFLATGFPEGLPLPPLEALACGCVPVGFTGMGGCDYMRQAPHENAFVPWWPMDGTPELPANGFYAADGDIPRAAHCLELALGCLLEGGNTALALFDGGQAATAFYSQDRFRDEAVAFWRGLEGDFRDVSGGQRG